MTSVDTEEEGQEELRIHAGMSYGEVAQAFDKHIYPITFRTPFEKYAYWHGENSKTFWLTFGTHSDAEYDGEALFDEYGYVIAFPVHMDQFQALINGELLEDGLIPYWDWESDPENAVLWIYEVRAAELVDRFQGTYRLLPDGKDFFPKLYLRLVRFLKTRMAVTSLKYVAGWAVTKAALDVSMHHAFSGKYLPPRHLGGAGAEEYNPVASHIVYADVKENRLYSMHTRENPIHDSPGQKVIEHKYKVFISYATAEPGDQATADEWKKALEQRLKKDVQVFLAPRSIEPGDNWRDILKKSLWDADALVLMLNEKTLESDWVQQELTCAWLLEPKVFTVLRCANDRLSKVEPYYSQLAGSQMIDGASAEAYQKLEDSIHRRVHEYRSKGRPCPIHHGAACPRTIF